MMELFSDLVTEQAIPIGADLLASLGILDGHSWIALLRFDSIGQTQHQRRCHYLIA